MMNIKGHYTIKCGEKVIRGNNLITLLGESFFMNRSVNNEFEPIQYIVLGTSSIKATKSDVNLGNETVRKKCVSEVNLNAKQIILYCSCTASEILGISEIGVANNEILISHDVFEAINEEFITDNIDSVEINYTFDLQSASQRTGWQYYTEGDDEEVNNIYYIVEETTVTGVTEKDSNSGYRSVNSLESLKLVTGAYYYDDITDTLFIRTINNDDPNSYKILIGYN